MLAPAALLTGVGWHEFIAPSLRDGATALFPAWFRRVPRRERVLAQYETADLAHGYERSYARPGVEGRLLRDRVACVLDLLANAPGVDLLDAGCGPGVIAHSLLRSDRYDFAVTAVDQSQAMIRRCVEYSPRDGLLRACVGDITALPFPDESFDVTLVTGVLEYTDARTAIGELARVTRPGGMVIASMLNPLCPYHLVQWILFRPALRVLGAIERAIGLSPAQCHGAAKSGIRALPPAALLTMTRRAGLTAAEVVYLTPTVLVPPLDRSRLLTRLAEWVTRAITARWLMHLMATAYLVIAICS